MYYKHVDSNNLMCLSSLFWVHLLAVQTSEFLTRVCVHVSGWVSVHIYNILVVMIVCKVLQVYISKLATLVECFHLMHSKISMNIIILRTEVQTIDFLPYKQTALVQRWLYQFERCADHHGQHKQRVQARIYGTYTYIRHLDKPLRVATHKSKEAQIHITQGKPWFKNESLVK